MQQGAGGFASNSHRNEFFKKLKNKNIEKRQAKITDIEEIRKTFQTTELESKAKPTKEVEDPVEAGIDAESSDEEFEPQPRRQEWDEDENSIKEATVEVEPTVEVAMSEDGESEHEEVVANESSRDADELLTRRKAKDTRALARRKAKVQKDK